MGYGKSGYDPKLDADRLDRQKQRIFSVMKDGEYRTLREIESLTGDPQASISARLREFVNKDGHIKNKRRRGEPKRGIWEYQIILKGDSEKQLSML